MKKNCKYWLKSLLLVFLFLLAQLRIHSALVEFDTVTIASSFPQHLDNVKYLNEQYVAWGQHGTIMTSKNGIDWDSHALLTPHLPIDLAYGESKYVCLTDHGDILASPDLINWKNVFSRRVYGFDDSKKLDAVDYVDFLGVFTVVGYEGTILESEDGITWGAVGRNIYHTFFKDIYAGPTKIYLLDSDEVASSTNGKKWNSEKTYPKRVEAMIQGESISIVGTSQGIFTTPDEQHWIKTLSLGNVRFVSFAYGAGVYLSIYLNLDDNQYYAAESDDGFSWETFRLGNDGRTPRSICFGNDRFVLVGEAGFIQISTLIKSPNLKFAYITEDTSLQEYLPGQIQHRVSGVPPFDFSWTFNEDSLPLEDPDLEFKSVSKDHQGAYSVKVSDSRGQQIINHFDLIVTPGSPWTSWTKVKSNPTQTLSRVRWLKNRFWAVGHQGTLRYSNDGKNWDTIDLNFSTNLNDIGLLGDELLIIGDDGLVISSHDGQSWTRVYYPSNSNLQTFHPGGPSPIIVGKKGLLTLYEENKGWIPITINTHQNLNDVEFFESGYQVVGNNGIILRSKNGYEWTDHSLLNRVNLNAISKGINGSAIVGQWNQQIVLADTNPHPDEWKQKASNVLPTEQIDWNAIATFRSGFVFGGERLSAFIYPHFNTIPSSWKDVQTTILSMAVSDQGLAVGVGKFGSILLSQPGEIKWEAIPEQQPSLQLHATHGNGYYVSVGFGGGMVSKDGIEWRSYPIPNSKSLNELLFLDPYFILVRGKDQLLKSTDGINWKTIETAPSGDWQGGVVYQGRIGLYTKSGLIAISDDLEHWSESQVIVNSPWVYGMVGHSGEFIVYGAEGVPIPGSTSGLSYGRIGFLFATREGNSLRPLKTPTGDTYAFRIMTEFNGQLLGYKAYSTNKAYVTTNSGETWDTPAIQFVDTEFRNNAIANTRSIYSLYGHLFVSPETDVIYHSSNGIQWESITPEVGIYVRDVIPFQGRAMIISSRDHILLSAPLTRIPNSAPSFSSGPDISVLEDEHKYVFPEWAKNINIGSPDEVEQSHHFQVYTENSALFADQPSIRSDGQLTFTPATDANGTTSVSVILEDNGGTAHGGLDHSVEHLFSITVLPVNDPPSFKIGEDISVYSDGTTINIPNWTNKIVAGPENESFQEVHFEIKTQETHLFEELPSLSSSGELSFTPQKGQQGKATVTIVLVDNGNTDNGGSDRSEVGLLTITILPVEKSPSPPSFIMGPNQIILEDDSLQQVNNWATEIIPGSSGKPFEFEITTDNPSLFSNMPSINGNGSLSYKPAPNANGTAHVTVVLYEPGNPPLISSPAYEFIISILPVNDPPSFDMKNELEIKLTQQIQIFEHWITSIDSGPKDEKTQTLTFNITTDHPEWFEQPPNVDMAGTLSFMLSPLAKGKATLFVTLMDDGGNQHGGKAESLQQKVILTIVQEDPPKLFISDIKQTTQGIKFKWKSEQNCDYIVMYKDDLLSPNWTVFLTTIYGNGEIVSFLDETPQSATRFYSILKVTND